jgi:alpha-tubulin suppressor-like RCC1 family protein
MTSLIYPANKTGCTNVLLVDIAVQDSQIFIDSVNAVTFPILYSSSSTKDELLGVLQSNFTTLDRIGLVFHGSGSGISVPFLDNAPFFITPETNPYSENVEFIINVIKQFQVKNIDYLACNTLQYPSWVDYYSLLTQVTSVIVGASNDQTGNIQYGGDWTMESTSEDIEFIYFTESIEYYTYLLGFVGVENTLLIKNGFVYGCGGDLGSLGTGNTSTKPTLTPMDMTLLPGLTPKYIASGSYHTVVLMTTGELYSCGTNDYGQLGTAVAGTKLTLTQMVNNTGLTPKYIASGSYHAVVLMTTGEIYCCGYNVNGQLGTAVSGNKTTLTQMVNNTGLTPKYIACGVFYTCVLMQTGEIYSCGDNTYGQLGTGVAGSSTLTIMVNSTNKTPASISLGFYHTFVLMQTGEIYGCGRNDFLQLGTTATPTTTLVPMNMTLIAGKTPKYIIGGFYHTTILMTTGEIYSCGRNFRGVFGNNASTGIANVSLTQMTPIADKTPKYIACGNYYNIVLMNDGTVYGCGTNLNKSLGINTTDTSYNSLQPMTDGTSVTYLMNNIDSLTFPTHACFKSDTKILTNNGYKPIQTLRKGDLVKTLLHGYKPIDMLGYSTFYHPCKEDRRVDQLYVCTAAKYPDAFEPLVLTGAHSILVSDFTDAAQRSKTLKLLKDIYVTDNKYRLPACVDARATVFENKGTYTIYHLALENENYYMNYGIFANGLLVETCGRHYLKECSGMTLVN